LAGKKRERGREREEEENGMVIVPNVNHCNTNKMSLKLQITHN